MKFYKGMTTWNKGLKGFGKWSKWFPKKEANPFYGKKHSQETIEKMRLAKLGKVGVNKGKHWIIDKSKLNNSNKCRGKNHWNWKGGITSKDKSERVKFRQTIQKQVFKRDKYVCQICGVKGKDITVDHIQPWAEYVELRFNMDNCRTLCQSCHYKITFGKPMPPTVRAWGHNLKEVTNYRCNL